MSAACAAYEAYLQVLCKLNLVPYQEPQGPEHPLHTAVSNKPPTPNSPSASSLNACVKRQVKRNRLAGLCAHTYALPHIRTGG